MSNVFLSHNLRVTTKIRILKCYIWSTMLYASESWTISREMQRRLEAAEMWFLRRMWRIPWTERITNAEVLERSSTRRSLIQSLAKRQLSFFGHVMRKEGLENLATTGYIHGKRARGRQRQTILDWFVRLLERGKTDILQTTRNRKIWQSMVADISI